MQKVSNMTTHQMNVRSIQTELFHRHESLKDFILKEVPSEFVHEKMILAITSKIVSLSEGRLVSKTSVTKKDLIQSEADEFLGELGYGCFLTVKEGLLIPSSGIDESNSEDGDFILYPSHPMESAKKIWSELRDAWGLQDLGILLTDSRTSPLRQGVTGVCLSYWGIQPVQNMVGQKDLFHRELKMTKVNIVDSLSSIAVLMMGEAAERQPLAIISGANIQFTQECSPQDLQISPSEDLYYPFFKSKMNP